MDARRLRVVGEAAQRGIGERVGAQQDQVVDVLGLQVQVGELPERVAAGRGIEFLAERGEQAAGQAARPAAGCGLADDLAEGSRVQPPQPGEVLDVVVGVQDERDGAVSGPRHRAGRGRCGSDARRARGGRCRGRGAGLSVNAAQLRRLPCANSSSIRPIKSGSACA
jgi:hypothetical protein